MSNFKENPRTSCALSGGLGVVGSINRAVPVLHVGPGCALQSSIGTHFDFLGGGWACPSTNMYEQEVVFGGEQRLRDTIRGSLEVMDGDVYVVLTGCPAGIIGDNINGVINEFSDSGYPIIGVETAGFLGDTYFGYNAVLTSLLSNLATKTQTQRKTVNLFGVVPNLDVTASGDFDELVRILGRIGVKANTFFFAPDGVEQLKNAGEAALNINFSPWLLHDAEEFLLNRFGIRTIHFPGLPVGPSATSEFLRTVGETLNLEKELVDKVIREEENYVYTYFERAVRELYRYIIVGDVNSVLGYSRFLTNDAGHVPIAVVITDNLPDDAKESVETVLSHLEYAAPPKVFYESDKYRIAELIRGFETKINLIIGSSYEKEIASELDIFEVTLSYPDTDSLILNKSHAGYHGSLSLIEDMYNNL